MAAPPAYEGDRLIERRLGPFRIDDTQYPSGLSMPRHAHEKPHLSCVIQGQFGETLGSNEFTRLKGTAIFRRSEFEHGCQFHDKPVRILRVQFEDHWLERIESMSDWRSKSFAAQSPLADSLTNRLIDEVRRDDGASALAAEGLVLELLAQALRGEPAREEGDPSWLLQVQDELHDGFLRQLSLTELAAEAGVSPSYLARTFRKRFGCTVGAYLRRLRVDYAADRLRHGDEPLADIAQAAGFADQGHFTRQFRRATGRTPGEYRRNALS